eukprot:SAG11_NODE_7157_length_1185_cov_1.826888_1_plen_142_part_10
MQCTACHTAPAAAGAVPPRPQRRARGSQYTTTFRPANGSAATFAAGAPAGGLRRSHSMSSATVFTCATVAAQPSAQKPAQIVALGRGPEPRRPPADAHRPAGRGLGVDAARHDGEGLVEREGCVGPGPGTPSALRPLRGLLD